MCPSSLTSVLHVLPTWPFLVPLQTIFSVEQVLQISHVLIIIFFHPPVTSSVMDQNIVLGTHSIHYRLQCVQWGNFRYSRASGCSAKRILPKWVTNYVYGSTCTHARTRARACVCAFLEITSYFHHICYSMHKLACRYRKQLHKLQTV